MPDVHNPANLAVFVSQDDVEDLEIAYGTVGPNVGLVDSDVKSLKDHIALRLGDYHLDVGKTLGINKVRVKINIEVLDSFAAPPYPVVETFTYDRDFDSDEFLLVQLSSQMRVISRGLEPNGDEKSPAFYTYANTAARLAATGFTEADIWKLAHQENTDTYWELVRVAPPKWRRVHDPRIHEIMQAAMRYPLGPVLFLDVTRDAEGKYTGGSATEGGLKLSPGMTGVPFADVNTRLVQFLIRVDSAFLKTGDGTVAVDQTIAIWNMRYPILCANGFTSPPHPDPHFAGGNFGFFNAPIFFNPFSWDVMADFYSEGYIRWPGASPPTVTSADYWKIGNLTSDSDGFIDFRLTRVGDNFLWVQEGFDFPGGLPPGVRYLPAHKVREISFTLRDSFE